VVTFVVIRGHGLCMACVTLAALPVATSAIGAIRLLVEAGAGPVCQLDALGGM
jgi:hypothetical protein